MDLLKPEKRDCIITDEEYSTKVLHFAEKFLIKNTTFDILGILEKGTYGGVFIARERHAWQELSVKVVLRNMCTEFEVEDWMSSKHPNIVQLLYKQYIPRIDAYIFVTEFYTYTLENCLGWKRFKKNTNAFLAVKKFLREILEGLNYLHKRNCSNLNITGRNVWISNDFRAVIGNFKTVESKECEPKERKVLNHEPPESCEHLERSVNLVFQKHDAWSYGILAMNVFTKNYIQKKAPSEVTNWCDEIYPVVFKIVQPNYFKKHTKKAFPASKTDMQTRSTMLNFVTSCLRILPKERPSADVLLQHKYFRMDGLLSMDEGAWNKSVTKKTWFFKPSSAEIIESKKILIREIIETFVKEVESIDSIDENRLCRFDFNEDKKETRNSSKQNEKMNTDDGCKSKQSTNIPFQCEIKLSESNVIKNDCSSQRIIPETHIEANKTIQDEGNMEGEVKPLDETDSEKFKLESECYNDLSATTVVKWLKPILFKNPSRTNTGPKKLSRWVSYESINLVEPHLETEISLAEKQHSVTEPLKESNSGTDVGLQYANEIDEALWFDLDSNLFSDNYPSWVISENDDDDGGDIDEEDSVDLLACEQFKQCIHDSQLKLAKSCIIRRDLLKQQEENLKYPAEDSTKIELANTNSRSLPCLIGTLLEQSFQEIKTLPKNASKNVHTEEQIEPPSVGTVPSLSDVTNKLSASLQDISSVKLSHFELKRLFTSSEKRKMKGKLKVQNVDGRNFEEATFPQTSEICPEKIKIPEIQDISKEKDSTNTQISTEKDVLNETLKKFPVYSLNLNLT